MKSKLFKIFMTITILVFIFLANEFFNVKILNCEPTWIADKYRTLTNEMYLVAEYREKFIDVRVDTDSYERNDIYSHVFVCETRNELTGIFLKYRVRHVEE